MFLNSSVKTRVPEQDRQVDETLPSGGRESSQVAGIPNVWSLRALRVGLHVLSCSNGAAQDFSGNHREALTEDRCEALFVLAGTLRVCVMDGDCHEHYRVAAGRCNVRYFPKGCRLVDCLPEDSSVILRIGFTSPEMLGGGRLRREIDDAVRNGRPVTVDVPINSQMDRVITRLREAVERDSNGAALALSGALELVWHVVRSRESVSLSVAELENSAVDTARRILENRLDDPPSLEELAAHVGMSVSKFKQVFTRNCGKPPYAYLREVRLERAMCLLRFDGMRVTEAALEVGYNNLSYFAKAFEARFGIKPSRARGGK
jgi:AraC-like DNA-binding protein